ncbi:MAG: M14 family zinc carboxypeptidase [Bradymonadia bacterium]
MVKIRNFLLVPLVYLSLITTALCAPDLEGWVFIDEGRPASGDDDAQWSTVNGAWAPQSPSEIWWTPLSADHSISMALTAEFDTPTEIRGTLLFAAAPKRGKVRTGLGIRLAGRRAALVQVKGKRTRVLARFRFRSFFNRERVQITLRILGDTLVATAFDPDRQTPLGAGLYRGSEIKTRALKGIALLPRRRWVGGVRRLSGRPLCTLPAPTMPAVYEPPIVMALPAEDVDGAPYGQVMATSRRGKVSFLTDVDGLERHHCADHRLGDLVPSPPWRLRDPRYHAVDEAVRGQLAADPFFDAGYSDPQMVQATLEALAARFPRHSRLERLGTSHGGRPIYGLLIADDIHSADISRRPSVLINGAHHGNELLSVDFTLDAARQLLKAAAEGTSGPPRRWLSTLAIWCVPLVNPDGNAAYLRETSKAGRKNRRDVDEDGHLSPLEGVDLNRNYPFMWGAHGERGSRSDPYSRYFRGEGPATEPEVKAIMKLADAERFAASLSFHTGTIAVLTPYTIEKVENPKPDVAMPLAEAMAAAVGEHPQGRPVPVLKNLYPVDGVDQDWLMHTYGTVAMLVEGAIWTPVHPERRQRIIEKVRTTWPVLLDRVVDGPTISGEVVDARGRPVGAQVHITEIALNNGERWRARCRDGHFTRLLPSEGTYTLEVSVRGRRPHRQTVQVKGHTTVKISLPYPVSHRCPTTLKP